MNEAKNQINDLEHKEAKYNESEQQEEKRIQKNKKWGCVSSLSDNFKQPNIHFIGFPEGIEKGQEIRNLFEINNERKLP